AAPHSSAQSPPKADQKGKATPKGDPKQKGAPPPQQQQGEQQPQLTHTPWTKVCQTPPGANAKRVCFIGSDGHMEGGMVVVAAVLIEPEGEPRRILRVTLPLGMALQAGTRVIVDNGQPMNGPYVVCVGSGCMADYEAGGGVIAQLQTRQKLHRPGVKGNGQAINPMTPLATFCQAYDRPA